MIIGLAILVGIAVVLGILVVVDISRAHKARVRLEEAAENSHLSRRARLHPRPEEPITIIAPLPTTRKVARDLDAFTSETGTLFCPPDADPREPKKHDPVDAVFAAIVVDEEDIATDPAADVMSGDIIGFLPGETESLESEAKSVERWISLAIEEELAPAETRSLVAGDRVEIDVRPGETIIGAVLEAPVKTDLGYSVLVSLPGVLHAQRIELHRVRRRRDVVAA